mmetsp:Transcript_21025/g.46105  ORF Transcript_21025/g.46105 Transcript_21025/m.46105 type:complete len:236 (-) Transcript_21025:1186-1893(-)
MPLEDTSACPGLPPACPPPISWVRSEHWQTIPHNTIIAPGEASQRHRRSSRPRVAAHRTSCYDKLVDKTLTGPRLFTTTGNLGGSLRIEDATKGVLGEALHEVLHLHERLARLLQHYVQLPPPAPPHHHPGVVVGAHADLPLALVLVGGGAPPDVLVRAAHVQLVVRALLHVRAHRVEQRKGLLGQRARLVLGREAHGAEGPVDEEVAVARHVPSVCAGEVLAQRRLQRVHPAGD